MISSLRNANDTPPAPHPHPALSLPKEGEGSMLARIYGERREFAVKALVAETDGKRGGVGAEE